MLSFTHACFLAAEGMKNLIVGKQDDPEQLWPGSSAVMAPLFPSTSEKPKPQWGKFS